MTREELIKCAKEIQDFCSGIKYCIEEECLFMTEDGCIFGLNEHIPEEWELEKLGSER